MTSGNIELSDPCRTAVDNCGLNCLYHLHLDGLQISGQAGRDHIISELEGPTAGEIFALGAWALLDQNSDWWRQTLDLATSKPRSLPGLVEALDFLELDLTQEATDELLKQPNPDLRWVGIAACNRQRRSLEPSLWSSSLHDESPSIRAAAYEAIGIFGERGLAEALRLGVADPEAEVRYQALKSGALLGQRQHLAKLQVQVLSEEPWAYEALELSLRALTIDKATQWLVRLFGDENTRRLALMGAGILGLPGLMPSILSSMAQEDVARVAMEAFLRITGLDPQAEGLEGSGPDGFESGPNDDPEDDDVAMDPDEALPWPDSEACQQWWNRNQGEFPASQRHLLGAPLTKTRLILAMKEDIMKYRPGHAVQIVLDKPGSTLFPTNAPVQRQLKILECMR